MSEIRIASVKRVIYETDDYHILALTHDIVAIIEGEERPAVGGKQYIFRGRFDKHKQHGKRLIVDSWEPWVRPTPSQSLDRAAARRAARAMGAI